MMKRKTILASLKRFLKTYLTFFAFLLVVVIGSLDFITGYDVSISVLYLFPVILIAWFEGGVPATIVSIFSAVTWGIADLVSGHLYFQRDIAIWNALMVLTLFLIVAYPIVLVKKMVSPRKRCNQGER
jgi:hypothetical protein